MDDPWADAGSNLNESNSNKSLHARIDYSSTLPSVADIFGNSGASSMMDSISEPNDTAVYGVQNNWGEYNSFNIMSDASQTPVPSSATHRTSRIGTAHDRNTRKDPLTDRFNSMAIDSKQLQNADSIETSNESRTYEDENDENEQEEDTLVMPPSWRIWSDEEIKKFNPLSLKNSKDGLFVRVREIPEKEGLVFKHINYLISHSIKFAEETETTTAKTIPNNSETKVIRRYSDFSWLVEVLWKKYPFRMIPELPPKKFASSSNDVLFLQKRRRGLQRFLYQLCKHPVLGKESMVIMFLTVPNDFSNWKKFANIELNDEFEGIRINLPGRFKIDLSDVMKGLREEGGDDDFEDNVSRHNSREEVDRSKSRNETVINSINQIWNETPVNFKDKEFINSIAATNEMLSKLAEIWSKLYILVERIEKREIALAADQHRFSLLLEHVVKVDTHVFGLDNVIPNTTGRVSDETENMNVINSILVQISKYFGATKKAKEEEMVIISNEILEKWKSFQDYLISLHFLIERFMNFKHESERAIQDLLNKIIRSKDKIKQLKMKSDIRGSEVDKHINVLLQAMNELSLLISRIFLVKTTFINEYKLFQKVKYLISEVLQDWFQERSVLADKQNDYIQRLLNDLRDLPLST